MTTQTTTTTAKAWKAAADANEAATAARRAARAAEALAKLLEAADQPTGQQWNEAQGAQHPQPYTQEDTDRARATAEAWQDWLRREGREQRPDPSHTSAEDLTARAQDGQERQWRRPPPEQRWRNRSETADDAADDPSRKAAEDLTVRAQGELERRRQERERRWQTDGRRQERQAALKDLAGSARHLDG